MRAWPRRNSAYTVMTALKAVPAGQNTLAEPAPQAGSPGPVTLILGANFAGVNPPSTGKQTAGSAAGAEQLGREQPASTEQLGLRGAVAQRRSEHLLWTSPGL